MRKPGNSPDTTSVIQSRVNPSGTSFSKKHEITQEWQPTHRFVSITIPYLAIGVLCVVYGYTTNVTKLTFIPVPPMTGSVL